MCFQHVDLLSNCMEQVEIFLKLNLTRNYTVMWKRKKKLSVKVLNCSLEQKQLLCFYLLCRIKRKMKRSLKLGKMLNAVKKSLHSRTLSQDRTREKEITEYW